MKKSLIALLVVLALIVTVSVFSVSADGEATTTDYTLTITEDGATAACPCPEHNGETATFEEYAANSTISIAGAYTLHYYLSDNVAHTTDNRAAGTDDTVVIHLNGHTLSYSGYVFNNWNSGSNLYLVADAEKGGIVRTTGSQAAMRSSSGNVYSYNVTYARANGAPSGTLAGATIALRDSGEGVFHMYGGTIEGVDATGNGGAVQITNGGAFYMHSGTIKNCSATAAGGAAYISNGSFYLSGGTVESCGATTTGGAFSLTGSNAKLYIDGANAKIKTCRAANGGAIYAEAGAYVEMSDGEIDSCYITGTGHGGAARITGTNVKFKMTGGTIKNCYTSNGTAGTHSLGGAIYLNGTSPTFEMDGANAKITGCKAKYKGGSIYAADTGATVTLKAGTIENGFCWGTQIGGNICMDNGTLNISGATISGGYTTDAETSVSAKPEGDTAGVIYGGGRGGNIAVRGAAVLNMTAGTVKDGVAFNGANILIEDTGTGHIISGGTVSGGYAQKGGNITVQGGRALTISNANENVATLIDDGTATSGGGGNIYITGASGSVSSVTMTGGTVSNGDALGSSNAGGGVYLYDYATFTMSGGKLDRNTSVLGGGNLRPRTVNCTINISGTAELANGTVTNGDGANLFTNVAADVNITGGTFTGGTGANGANIGVANATAADTFSLSGAKIVGGTATSKGGGLYLGGTPEGGKISNCKFNRTSASGGNAVSGGMIYLNGDVTIENCQFGDENASVTTTGGSASSYGGAIYVAENKTLTMTNTTIYKGNSHRGGAIYVASGATADIIGCTLKDCTAGLWGGNLHNNGGTVNICNTVITGGKKAANTIRGGNIYLQAGTINVSNDSTKTNPEQLSVISNGAAGDGGNVFIWDGVFNLGAGTTISGGSVAGGTMAPDGAPDTTDNKSTGNGGNVYVHGGTFETNGTIDGGSATKGGNIYAAGNAGTDAESMEDDVYAIVNMNGGTVSNGTATNDSGGGIYMAQYATFTMTDGTFSGNTSKYGGGAIRPDGTNVTVNISGGQLLGGNVEGNNVTNGDGGILFCNNENVTINITGGTFSGGKASGVGGNVAITKAASLIIENAEFIDGTSGSTGGNVYLSKTPTEAISGCTFTGGTAATNGGSLYLAGSADTTLDNCTFNGGNAENGGNLYVHNGTITVNGGEFADGTAKVSGGNIYVNSSVTNRGANFTGVIVKDGKAGEDSCVADANADIAAVLGYGGNIHTASWKATYSNCVVSGGVTGVKKTDDSGTEIKPDTNGRGGNFAVMSSTDIINCTITNGESYSSAAGGGNLYYGIGSESKLENCTITGGHAFNNGGNIQNHSGTANTVLTITGNTTISGGVSHVAWGGNVANTNSTAKTLISGNTVIDGADARASSEAVQQGKNIAVYLGSIEIGGNAVVRNGGGTGRAEGIAVREAASGITVSGNPTISDNVFLRCADRTADPAETTHAVLTIAEGFTGYVRPKWQSTTLLAEIEFGEYLSATAQSTIVGYTGTGTVLVVQSNGTGIPIQYMGTEDANGLYKYVGFVAYKDEGQVDENGDKIYTEYPLADLTGVTDDDGYAYIKIYVNDDSGSSVTGKGTITLTSSTPIDQNDQNVHIVTNGHTLNMINYRTEGGAAAGASFTVDNAANVAPVVTNPVNGYTYLNIKDEGADTWTSNCVRVELKQVSVRPEIKDTTGCGVYYTAEITANSKAAACLSDYGVVAGLKPDAETIEKEGLVSSIDKDFMTIDSAERWYKWTNKSIVATEAIIGEKFNSGLIKNIMNSVEFDAAQNKERGELDIVTKAYVTVNIGGNEEKILTDEVSLSMRDLVEKLDEKYATLNSNTDANTMSYIEEFFGNYVDVMKQWATPNLNKKFNIVVENNEAA